jgi:hypothetical protein
MANVIGPYLGSRPGSRRLCILSGRPLRAREFVETLEIELSPNDQIEFIPDRRRSSARPPSVDRRRQSPVDSWLQKHDFAIVPAALPSEHRDRRLAPPPTAAAIDRPYAPHANSDASRLERIRGVTRRRKIGFRLQLVVGALAGVVIGVTLANVLLPTLVTMISRVRATAAPVTPQTYESPPVVSPVAQVLRPIPPPSVTESPPSTESSAPTVSAPVASEPSRPSLPDRPVPPQIRRPETQEGERTRDAGRLLHGGPRPGNVSPAPEGRSFRPLSSVSGGLPTMEIERRRAPASEGGGETYALRLSDTAGQTLTGAEVSLVIRLADGSLFDLPAAAGSEPGTYQVTVPPLQSTPVDLRIRVATSDTRVEIPLTR